MDINPFLVLQEAITNKILISLSIVVIGIFIAKLASSGVKKINSDFQLISIVSLNSLTRLLELLIFTVFLVISLGALGVGFAQEFLIRLWNILPNIVTILITLLLGYIVINLVVDVLNSFFMRIGRQDYLAELGVSSSMIQNVFFILKLFLYLVLFSVILNYYASPVPFFDSIITGVVFTFIFFAGALFAYSFKDYAANAMLSKHVEQAILKPGQKIKIDNIEGEVVSITSHATIVETSEGYNYVIPNKNLLTKEFLVGRVRSNIVKIESLMKNFTPQHPSYCGPASASMMLRFFGYNISQDEMAELAKTKVPGGTEPADLIDAVKKVTNSEVKGRLIRFDEIFDLAEEVRSWIMGGAMVILWYKKPVLFPDKKSRSGHYVLCVGAEGDELIVMDPSSETAGVYLVNKKLLEEAMDEYDISRGYIVFAKKGTSSSWRLNEGLIYGNVSSYKNLSKSFERYLKRQLRQRQMVSEIVSEHLFSFMKDEKVKHVWKPDLTSSKQKQMEEQNTVSPGEEKSDSAAASKDAAEDKKADKSKKLAQAKKK